MNYEGIIRKYNGSQYPKLLELMDKYKYVCSKEYNDKPNYIKIPVNVFDYSEEGIEEFNNIYNSIYELKENLPELVRTRSGGISYKHGNWQGFGWFVQQMSDVVEIIFCYGAQFRFQIRHSEKVKDGISGSTAFKIFKQECAEWGININDYSIDNGAEVKKEIEQPMIQFIQGEAYQTYDNVHHLDFNSAWPAGIVEEFPELRQPIENIYSRRKFDKGAKAVLTHAPGYMQSAIIDYQFAHISKAGINNCNKHMREMITELIANGRKPLLTNTDGIWYQGDLYHNSNEGTKLGQWKHDYTECVFRAKSEGCYEFIGTEVKTNKMIYKPVVRGKTKLDLNKPRAKWSWGDIFTVAPLISIFVEGKGIVKVNYDESDREIISKIY